MKSSSPYFEETQWLRDSRWTWFVALISGLSTLIPLLYLVYWQLFNGEPVGDKPMSDTGIVIFLCAFAGMTVVTIIVIRIIRLSVYVDEEGVHYNFFPSTRGWKVISKEVIVKFELLTKRNFFEYLATGYSTNRFTKTRRMSFRGSRIVRFQLSNHWKIIIGTQKPEEFLGALKRMTGSAPNIF